MASTRNRNTPGNYQYEQRRYNDHLSRQIQFPLYGSANETQFPGDGLVGMKTNGVNLSQNTCDIETQLFGIGSTNLVDAKPEVLPQIYTLNSANIADKMDIHIPTNKQWDHLQRPMFLN